MNLYYGFIKFFLDQENLNFRSQKLCNFLNSPHHVIPAGSTCLPLSSHPKNFHSQPLSLEFPSHLAAAVHRRHAHHTNKKKIKNSRSALTPHAKNMFFNFETSLTSLADGNHLLKASKSAPSNQQHAADGHRRSFYDNEDNAFEDNDSEMASLDGVSDADKNDNSINSLQNASSNNFARTFINNTRRRMSSGLVLSYNFLKGASGQRRDST